MINSHNSVRQRNYQDLDNDNCSVETFDWIFEGSSTSAASLYTEEITEETLQNAMKIYFRIVFCPDYDKELVAWYSDLTGYNPAVNLQLPLEEVLKTMARLKYQAKMKEMTEHYYVAKILLDEAATMMNLEYKDIVWRTTRASELELYPDLQNHTVNTDFVSGKH